MSYCVYKHTFPNGKVYIGITGRKPEIRWGNDGNGYKHQHLMANAINKYGWDNIQHEILYNGLNKEEAEQKEIELIAKYQSTNNKFGYNATNGGNTIGTHTDEVKRKLSEQKIGEKNPYYGKRHSDEEKKKIGKASRDRQAITGGYWNGKKMSEETKRKISEAQKGKVLSEETKRKMREAQRKRVFTEEHKKKIREVLSKRNGASFNARAVRCIETGIVYSSQSDASRQTGIGQTNISAVCNGKMHTAGGYHWEFVKCDYQHNNESTLCKSVRCIETDTIYCSIKSASDETNINKWSIGDTCRGKQKTAGGYHWEFIDEELKNKALDIANSKIDKRKKKVRCIETGIVYESATQAQRETGISQSNISCVCRGKQKTAGGYHWEFVEEQPQ